MLKDSEEQKTANKNKKSKGGKKNTPKKIYKQVTQIASQAACSSSSSKEPQTFPASAMAPVCFRTCRVRRFLDDICTSAAYYGKKEKSCSNLEQLKRETNGEEDWKGRYKHNTKKESKSVNNNEQESMSYGPTTTTKDSALASVPFPSKAQQRRFRR